MKNPIEKVYLFDNSMMAVFDGTGQQIPELQGPLIIDWAEKAKSLGYEVHNLIIETNGRKIRIFEWEFDGEKGINFEQV